MAPLHILKKNTKKLTNGMFKIQKTSDQKLQKDQILHIHKFIHRDVFDKIYIRNASIHFTIRELPTHARDTVVSLSKTINDA